MSLAFTWEAQTSHSPTIVINQTKLALISATADARSTLARPVYDGAARCARRQFAPRGACRVHGRQEGLCSLARFLLGRKPRLRRPAARADGLAANSPTRL